MESESQDSLDDKNNADTASTKHVVISGNPVDGVSLFGPFDSFEDAGDYAQQLINEWWITTIKAP